MREMQKKNDEISGQLNLKSLKCEELEKEMKVKMQEIQKIAGERDNAKRQCLNLQSLLKQLNEEREVKNT